MDKQQVWASALQKLEKEVSTISYDLWIKSLEPIDFKDNVFYLTTTSEQAKNRILAILKSNIHEALTSSCDDVKDFVILDPLERDEYNKAKEVTVNIDNQKLAGVNNFNAKYTLDFLSSLTSASITDSLRP